jgi:hypothetical protein
MALVDLTHEEIALLIRAADRYHEFAKSHEQIRTLDSAVSKMVEADRRALSGSTQEAQRRAHKHRLNNPPPSER